MNNAWWFIAGVLTGWIATCLTIGLSLSSDASTHINRFLRKLRLPPIQQHQNQTPKPNSQLTEKHQERGKS